MHVEKSDKPFRYQTSHAGPDLYAELLAQGTHFRVRVVAFPSTWRSSCQARNRSTPDRDIHIDISGLNTTVSVAGFNPMLATGRPEAFLPGAIAQTLVKPCVSVPFSLESQGMPTTRQVYIPLGLSHSTLNNKY